MSCLDRYSVVTWRDGKCTASHLSLSQDTALRVLKEMTDDSFWDGYDRIYPPSREQEYKDGFTAVVRSNGGLVYAVPIRLLDKFVHEHTREVK